jgi:hypothetical protein
MRLGAASPMPGAEQISIADECARRTLDICMSKMLLNNLERARLLDILLWWGDLVSSFGPKKTSSTSRPPAGRVRYEKPYFRHEIPGAEGAKLV